MLVKKKSHVLISTELTMQLPKTRHSFIHSVAGCSVTRKWMLAMCALLEPADGQGDGPVHKPRQVVGTHVMQEASGHLGIVGRCATSHGAGPRQPPFQATA